MNTPNLTKLLERGAELRAKAELMRFIGQNEHQNTYAWHLVNKAATKDEIIKVLVEALEYIAVDVHSGYELGPKATCNCPAHEALSTAESIAGKALE